MAAITLQKVRPFSEQQNHTVTGPVTGNIYLVNPIGQVTVNSADVPYLLAAGYALTEPGSGPNVSLLDFGAFPGSNFATVTVGGVLPGVDSSAVMEAFVVAQATVDHSADEHAVDGPIVSAVADGNGNVVITAYPNNNVPKTDSMMPWGKWSVAWSMLQ